MLAILAILEPDAINKSKFTSWNSLVLAIPPDKIAKAHSRVLEALHSRKINITTLLELLRNLRHVTSCMRSARPFYQRLHSMCVRAPCHGSVVISPGAQDDLLWFHSILECGSLGGMPTSLFGDLPPPDVYLYMDARNSGLCVPDPASTRCIQVGVDSEEPMVMAPGHAFNINVREHFAIALACLLLGSTWYQDDTTQWPHYHSDISGLSTSERYEYTIEVMNPASAERFQVTCESLRMRFAGLIPLSCRRESQLVYINEHAEAGLLEAIEFRANKGMCVSTAQFRDLVRQAALATSLKPVPDKFPGLKWVQPWVKRHRDAISYRKGQILGAQRAECSNEHAVRY
ncbi:hypothetical protein PHPALM_32003 [Phytophthora palmivora]|uniref:Uncharacterized protein n=1 Tax=Phytophthora palmivora TaxID=4796 RepID=A0A2P4X166_9STRA|nr:hypothetical protein PHPALM_32003 [Phytophthora palmivora]